MADVEKVKFVDVLTNGSRLIFKLGNGSRVEIDVEKLTGPIRERALYHGVNQKVRDAAAGFSKGKDFAGAQAAMQAVVDTLMSGEWARKGGAKAAIVEVDLAAALARYKKTDDLAKCLLVVQKADTATREKWLENKTMKAFYDQAKADRVAREAEAGTEDAELEIDLEEESGEG